MKIGDKVVMSWQWGERAQNGDRIRCHVFEIKDIDKHSIATLERNDLTFSGNIKDFQLATDEDIAWDRDHP